jgi:hypothetical protein
MSIAYICSFRAWTRKIARHRFHAIKALGSMVDVQWSGPGWPNYRDDVDFEEALSVIYGDRLPRFIISFPFAANPPQGFAKTRVPKCYEYDEMRDSLGFLRAADEVLRDKVDLVVGHYQNDVNCPDIQKLTLSGVRVHHLPIGVCPEVFYPQGETKDLDVLLVGTHDEVLYPLRWRMRDALSILRERYGLSCMEYQSPAHLDRATDQHLRHYADSLRTAKVVLSCSSKHHYALAKFVEVPRCGAVLVSDLPGERNELFSRVVVSVDATMSPLTIAKTVREIIGNPVRLRARAEEGFHLVKGITSENYATSLLELLERYERHPTS